MGESVPTQRSYEDACGIARALDTVGERWALLVVRELLLGPQRFTDLRRALPRASSNLIADRLRELEERGVVTRRTLPPPAGSRVYELTEWGRKLEPVLLALGEWGLQVPLAASTLSLSPTSVLLYLRSLARPDPDGTDASLNLKLDSSCWTLKTSHGEVEIINNETPDADATLRTDPHTLNSLIGHAAALDTAISSGKAEVAGDLVAIRRVLTDVGPPER
jgi:DNA-binding HxlR family transcriptional regulator